MTEELALAVIREASNENVDSFFNVNQCQMADNYYSSWKSATRSGSKKFRREGHVLFLCVYSWFLWSVSDRLMSGQLYCVEATNFLVTCRSIWCNLPKVDIRLAIRFGACHVSCDCRFLPHAVSSLSLCQLNFLRIEVLPRRSSIFWSSVSENLPSPSRHFPWIRRRPSTLRQPRMVRSVRSPMAVMSVCFRRGVAAIALMYTGLQCRRTILRHIPSPFRFRVERVNRTPSLNIHIIN